MGQYEEVRKQMKLNYWLNRFIGKKRKDLQNDYVKQRIADLQKRIVDITSEIKDKQLEVSKLEAVLEELYRIEGNK